MTTYPTLNTQVIGQAERALDAILSGVLEKTGTTIDQWLVLTVTAAAGGSIGHEELVDRIAGTRLPERSAVQSAIEQLADAGLTSSPDPTLGAGQLSLTPEGERRYREIRTPIGEITARLFGGIPGADLATAGRVLAIVTDRAHKEITPLQSPS